jgi:hypothetical protein
MTIDFIIINVSNVKVVVIYLSLGKVNPNMTVYPYKQKSPLNTF